MAHIYTPFDKDLDWMADVEVGEFANDAVPVEKLQEWFAANPTGFYVVADQFQRIGQLNLLPFYNRSDQFGKFLQGEVSEPAITRSWLVSTSHRSEIRYLYVESIVLHDIERLDRKKVIFDIFRQIYQIIDKLCDLTYARTTIVYAMEATGYGKKLIKSVGFNSVGVNGGHEVFCTTLDVLIDELGFHYGESSLGSREKYKVDSSARFGKHKKPVTIQEIIRSNDPLLWPFLDLYISAFPPEERSSMANHTADLTKGYKPDPNRQIRRLAVTDEDGNLMAMARYSLRPLSGIVYLTYFAVAEGWRGQGIGADFFEEIAARCVKEVPDYKVMVWELEVPELISDPEAKFLAERRQRFYEGLGATVVQGIKYQIQNAGQPAVPMNLMYRFRANFTMPEHEVRDLIKEFFPFTNVGEPPAQQETTPLTLAFGLLLL